MRLRLLKAAVGRRTKDFSRINPERPGVPGSRKRRTIKACLIKLVLI